MGYWNATEEYLSHHGGQGPICPHCGKEMFVQDDHGRFGCFCCAETFDTATGTTLPAPPSIPQVDTSGMTDEEKAKVPPLNRLNVPPTAAEQRLFRLMLGGPGSTDSPEYFAALKAVEEERAGKK